MDDLMCISDMCIFECYLVCVCTKLGCKRFMSTSIVSINVNLNLKVVFEVYD
jgi:hypothetical protein